MPSALPLRPPLPGLALLLLTACAVALPTAAAAQGGPRAGRLQAPFVIPPPRPGSRAAECPPTTPPVAGIDVESRYAPGDRTASRIDPARQAANVEAMAPVNAYLAATSLQANRFVRGGGKDVGAANCALTAIAAWARADALKTAPGTSNRFKLSTTIAGIGLTYLQVRHAVPGFADDRLIAAWLARRAADIRAGVAASGAADTARNNHRYWAGLASATAGVAANDRQAFDWGMETLRMGACSVDPAGALSEEMKRGKEALHYQIYALNPLIALAELAENNGVRGYELCNGGVRRAAEFALRAAEDPGLVQARTGKAQSVFFRKDGAFRKSDIGWLAPYARRFTVSAAWRERIRTANRLPLGELGGDQLTLYTPLK